MNQDNLSHIVYVLKSCEDVRALKEKADEVRALARKGGETCKELFETEGLIGGLIRLMEIGFEHGEGFRKVREKALGAIWRIAYHACDDVKKGLQKYDGLVDCLLGRMRQGGKVERDCSVGAIMHISRGDNVVKKGLLEHEGLIDRLMDGLVELLGKKGNEYKKAREYAVEAIKNISWGDNEVKAGLFHFPGLMPRIEEIIGDVALDDTDTKKFAKKVKEKVKQSCPVQTTTSATTTLARSVNANATGTNTLTASSDTSKLARLESEVTAIRSQLTTMQDSLTQMASVLNSVAANISAQSSKRSHSDINDSSGNSQSSAIGKFEHIKKMMKRAEE